MISVGLPLFDIGKEGTGFLSSYYFKFAPLEQAKSFEFVNITLIGNDCEDVTKMFVVKIGPPLRHNEDD